MSTNATITWSDISTLKSSINQLQSKLGNGVAVFQKKDYESSVQPVTDLSFILMETTAVFSKDDTRAVIKTPQITNANWISSINTSYFIVLSDVKSSSTDKGTYSSALYTSVKSATDLGTAGAEIGEVKRDSKAPGPITVTVDILFIALNP